MRIAILSDIHGNSLALETAVSAIARDGVDRVVCPGDVAEGGPWSYEIISFPSCAILT